MFHIEFILIDCPFTCIFNKAIYTIACNCSTRNVDSFSCTLTDTRTSAPVAESKILVLHVRCPDMRPIPRMSLSVLYKQRESSTLNVDVGRWWGSDGVFKRHQEISHEKHPCTYSACHYVTCRRKENNMSEHNLICHLNPNRDPC